MDKIYQEYKETIENYNGRILITLTRKEDGSKIDTMVAREDSIKYLLANKLEDIWEVIDCEYGLRIFVYR